MILDKKIITIIIIITATLNCAKKRYIDEASLICSKMTLEQKIGQMIMFAIPGSSINKRAELLLRRYMPGGVVLFGYNLTTRRGIKIFISNLQKASSRHSKIPLFVSIDQEGGRVKRIRSGVTQFPGNIVAGISGEEELVYKWGKIIGIELRRIGVNMNLAPVLDVNNNPDNPVINTRSFGSDPKVVAEMGVSYIKGIQESGCIAVGKHFPGHGDTNKDSHLTLPVIPFSIERLKRVEFLPFRRAISEGVESIMTAHIAFPEILGNNDPATVSRIFLTDILRNDMNFEGLVITDDMEMNAISKKQDMGEAAIMSVIAGADIVLISSYGKNIPVIFNALRRAVNDKRISEKRINKSVNRIIETKLRYDIMSCVKGTIAPGKISFRDKDLEILDEADKINSYLSRKGIFYYGRKGLINPDNNFIRIYITPSKILSDLLGDNSDNIIFHSFKKFVKFYSRRPRRDAGKKIILYLHIVKPDINIIKSVSEYCRKNKIDFVILSSGNPFPITRSGLVKSALFSFSDTDESIRQLGNCLNGKFLPKKKINFYLGIETGR